MKHFILFDSLNCVVREAAKNYSFNGSAIQEEGGGCIKKKKTFLNTFFPTTMQLEGAVKAFMALPLKKNLFCGLPKYELRTLSQSPCCNH